MTTAPITDAERARVAGHIAYIKAHLPSFVPFFKDLHALGMVTGWRDVDYTGPEREGPKGITVADMVLESAAALKARMKHGNH